MLVLNNIELNGGELENIYINSGRIMKTLSLDNDTLPSNATVVTFESCLALPGLVNSHDHLEFNLFPQLGDRVYNNYLEWGTDIHRRHKKIILDVLRIPKRLRAKWGVYKNLLSGVTTVMHHGQEITDNTSAIDIYTQAISLHSVKLETHWKRKLNHPFRLSRPYVIHIGEGIDALSGNEIITLQKNNFLHKSLIGVHGITMDEEQAKGFRALIWCPVSNFFLYDKTAPVDKLKHTTPILFGTDATVSASWNIWEHLRVARNTRMLSDNELFDSVTSTASRIWKLESTGEIKNGFNADVIILKKTAETKDYYEQVFAGNPEDIQLILSKGNIIFFDSSLLPQLKNIAVNNYAAIYINGQKKYIIGNLPQLMKEIKKIWPDANFPIDA